MNGQISRLLEHIPLIHQNQRFIFGIDGLSRSGKSTLAKHLQAELQQQGVPCCLLHIDDYIVERAKRYYTGHQEWREYYELQWDIDKLTHTLFEPLKQDESLSLPYYKSELDTHHIQQVILPKSCVVIIEGVFLQRTPWRRYFDFMVYLDCPREERFKRESESTQLNLNKFKDRYWKAEDFYVEVERPMRSAHLVIEG